MKELKIIKIETDWSYEPEPSFKEELEIQYEDGKKEIIEACVNVDEEKTILLRYDDYVHDVCHYKKIEAVKIREHYIILTRQYYGSCPRESGDHCLTYIVLIPWKLYEIRRIVKKTVEKKVYPMEPIEERSYEEVLYEAQ